MAQRRSLMCAAVVCLTALAVASCATGSGSTVPPTTGSSPAAPPVSALPQPGPTAEPGATGEFPAELVGTWSGDGNQSLTFTAGGGYRSNGSLGEGQAVAGGGQITLTSHGGSPVVTTWSVSGGRLYLGTSVYLRDDDGSGSLSLVGSWIEADGYALFHFAAGGTYDFSDQARGLTSAGTYAVDGRTLTIVPSGREPSTFGLEYDGTYLTFVNPDGSSAGQYVRVG